MNIKLIATGLLLSLAAVGCESPPSGSDSADSKVAAAEMRDRESKEAQELKDEKARIKQDRKDQEKEADRNELRQRAELALERLKKTDPTMAKVLRESKGYAVFPTVGKGGVGVGGAHGDGVLYEGGWLKGYCELTQASVGLQLGGQTYSEVIVFSTTDALNHLKVGSTTLDAHATAVAVKSGAGANAQYRDGVAVFTFDEAGLMFEASLGGQKFSYEPK